MKRFFTLLLLTLAIAGITTTSQAQQTKYHGEVYVAGGYGIGTLPLHRAQLHTIHGVRVAEVVSVGVGVGLDILTDLEDGIPMIPIFADLKLYAPTAGKFDPFLMLDIGYSLEPRTQLGGMTFGAGLGFKAGVFAMSVGYHLQQLSVSGVGINMGALQLKLGVAF